MVISPSINRAAAIPRMKAAIAAGKSASSFLKEMQAKDLGYRRTTFLADYRSVGNIEAKKDLIKYVRKDYLPSPRLYADVTWDLSREYLYKLKVQTRLKPGEPLAERFLNIVTDRPMTPGELESEIAETIWTVSGPPGAKLETVIVVAALKRAS